MAPRERQTERTRLALTAAADELWEQGRVPTVADVAERAGVGRATAYRYFPTQESLLLDTTFLGDQDAMRAIPKLAETIEDPAERVAEAVRMSARWALENEARMRMVFRAALDPASDTKRPARRRGYIKQLLASEKDELPKETYDRLAGSLTLLLGIDPILAMVDNSDVKRDEIPDVLAWTAEALVRSALAEASPRSRPPVARSQARRPQARRRERRA